MLPYKKMKVKRFKNLWAMGLILFGSILVVLYIAKIFFPEFIVGVAEIPAIIEFGQYVDSHWWAYYVFTFFVSFATYYFYCCACCRENKLAVIDLIIVAWCIIFLFIVEKFLPLYYAIFNQIVSILMPTIICFLHKKKEIKYMYSTVFVFIVHLLAQILSAEIRDIISLISYPNTATFTILMIDGFIWLILLYNYFNYKGVKENG